MTLRGTLVYADGRGIQSLDLLTGEQQRLFPATDSVSWSVTEGLSPVGDSVVVFSADEFGGRHFVFELNLRTGDTTAIGESREASADPTGRYMSWYADPALDDPGSKFQVGALDSVQGTPVFSDFGPTSGERPGEHWVYFVRQPVWMDSGWIACTRGTPGHLALVQPTSGRVRMLDPLIAVPVFWRSRARILVVEPFKSSGPAWEIDFDGHWLRRLPGLEHELGHAVLGGGDTVLFSAWSRRWVGISEANDLMMLDLESGEVRLVAEDVRVSGRAWYRPQ